MLHDYKESNIQVRISANRRIRVRKNQKEKELEILPNFYEEKEEKGNLARKF